MERARHALRHAEEPAEIETALFDDRVAFEENILHNQFAVEHKVWRSADGWRLITETWSVAERLMVEIRAEQEQLNQKAAPSAPRAPPTALPDPSGRAVITDGRNPVGMVVDQCHMVGVLRGVDLQSIIDHARLA